MAWPSLTRRVIEMAKTPRSAVDHALGTLGVPVPLDGDRPERPLGEGD